jgi:hypothetical protein
MGGVISSQGSPDQKRGERYRPVDFLLSLGRGASLGFGKAKFPGESGGHLFLAKVLGIFDLSDPTKAIGTIL